MDFRVLGTLGVLDEGRPVAITAPRQRTVLAVLLVHANEVVSTDRLLDLVWGDDQIKKLFQQPDFSIKKIAKDFVSEAECQMILKALRHTEWNRKKAAKELGVSYKTLLNRIEEFDLKP